jgi:hypothetical protein
MANQYLKYWLVTGAAIVVCIVVLFWKPSATYTASIYREPDYVQQPYFLQASGNCGSLWAAATGGLAKDPAPQYPPPATESPAQYLALLTGYVNTQKEHGVCGPQRENLGLVLGGAVAVAVVSEVLRRRMRTADDLADIAAAEARSVSAV